MTSMVLLLRLIVEDCNEARSMAGELSGRFAEHGIVNPHLILGICASLVVKCHYTLFKS